MLLVSGALCAQEYSFRSFGVTEGLNNLGVLQIYQDRVGFLWVSTENGIYRFDGDRFEAFGLAQAIPASAATAFGDAPDGSLLVGGAIGLYHLQGSRFEKVQGDFKAGAEALVRWNHPQKGLLPPGQFIPLAEQTGLILPLGDWVLEAACKQIAAWAGEPETASVTIAVNVSARQVRQADFVEKVLMVLDRTAANPKILKLELTESVLVEDVEEVIAKMTELKLHGLKFSLDDFGTGYSSLSYLRRLPLDELKIDRSFLENFLDGGRGGAIAKTIISLGSALGMSVLAEGVETEEQRDCLARLGCHSYQGFLFSKPVAVEQFEMLLPGCRRPAVVA